MLCTSDSAQSHQTSWRGKGIALWDYSLASALLGLLPFPRKAFIRRHAETSLCCSQCPSRTASLQTASLLRASFPATQGVTAQTVQTMLHKTCHSLIQRQPAKKGCKQRPRCIACGIFGVSLWGEKTKALGGRHELLVSFRELVGCIMNTSGSDTEQGCWWKQFCHSLKYSCTKPDAEILQAALFYTLCHAV